MQYRVEKNGGGMDPWILSGGWLPRLTLIFLVACFYLGAAEINNELFAWVEDAPYRHWIYLPAGIRLVLIMLLGWLGVTGYFIAIFFLTLSEPVYVEYGLKAVLFSTAADALALWMGLALYSRMTGVKSPWVDLSWGHIPFLALFTSVVRSTIAESVRHLQGIETLDSLNQVIRNVSLYAVGDTLGTVVVLTILIRLRKDYVAYSKS